MSSLETRFSALCDANAKRIQIKSVDKIGPLFEKKKKRKRNKK